MMFKREKEYFSDVNWQTHNGTFFFHFYYIYISRRTEQCSLCTIYFPWKLIKRLHRIGFRLIDSNKVYDTTTERQNINFHLSYMYSTLPLIIEPTKFVRSNSVLTRLKNTISFTWHSMSNTGVTLCEFIIFFFFNHNKDDYKYVYEFFFREERRMMITMSWKKKSLKIVRCWHTHVSFPRWNVNGVAPPLNITR